MVNLELSWQAAAVTAAGLAGAAAAVKRTGRPRLITIAAFARETATVLALFALWQLAGSYAVMGPDGAIARAQWIWHAERVIQLPSEAIAQRAFLPHPLIVKALNLYYAGLHFTLLIGCLLWLFLRYRRQYQRVRMTLILLTGSCLLVQLVPVAPPRLLYGDGMVDTAARYGQSVYGQVGSFRADQLSAMPSVHLAWALLVAVAIVQVSRSRWRWLALGYPALTLLAVIVTANHFWLDGIAAALLLAATLAVQRAARMVRRRLTARRQERSGADAPRRHVPDRPPVDA